MIHFLNKLITQYNNKHRTKKSHAALAINSAVFNSLVDGFYLVNLRSRNNNIVSRCIGALTQYREENKSAPISHTVLFYHGDIKAITTLSEQEKLLFKLDKYYVNPPSLSAIKNFVLCSADDSGMNYFDFSTYQFRDYSIRYLLIKKELEKEIAADLIRQWNKPYDVTGLLFWPLYRVMKFFHFFDDSKSWFCSEVYAEILGKHGIKISDKKNPSPADIEKYNHNLRIFMTSEFLR